MRPEFFEMIDAVAEIAPAAGRIRCRAAVPRDCSVYQGHFPGHPVWPGVLLVESMAQTCGSLLLVRNNCERLPYLAEIRVAKLRNFAPPGAELIINGKLEHEGSGYGVAHGTVEHDGKVIAESELRYRLLPFPSDSLRLAMLRRAAEIGLIERPVGYEADRAG